MQYKASVIGHRALWVCSVLSPPDLEEDDRTYSEGIGKKTNLQRLITVQTRIRCNNFVRIISQIGGDS